MNEVEIACPHCREVSVVSRAMLGKRGLCPRCRRPIEVPDGAPEASPGKQVGGPVRDVPDLRNAPTKLENESRPCPHCGEPILAVAVKCRHCGEFLDGRSRSHSGRPPNHLVRAILTTVCCCVPFGIVSIVYAAQVDSKWSQGDEPGAQQASQNAAFWSTLGLVLGVVANLIVLVLSALG